MKKKEQTKGRVKTRVFIRHGNADPKETIANPRHWDRRKVSEGRERKEKRAKNIKLKHELFSIGNLSNLLIKERIGMPDCRWTVTCALPARQLTARDLLTVIYDCGADRLRTPEDKRYLEIDWNDRHRVLHFRDLTDILPPVDPSQVSVAIPTQDR